MEAVEDGKFGFEGLGFEEVAEVDEFESGDYHLHFLFEKVDHRPVHPY